MSAKAFLRDLTPPLAWRALGRLRTRPDAAPDAPQFEHVPDAWERPLGSEWDTAAIAETYRAKWPRFVDLVDGTGPLGIAHESDLTSREDLATHNTVLSFAYAAARAARGGRLSVLDWGGGCGHYALLARAALPAVEVAYTARDVPALVDLGADVLPGDRFVSDDDAALDRTYDLIVVSGALHYARDWRALVARLAAHTGRSLLLTRLPVADGVASFPYVQRVPAGYGYGDETTFVGWCFGRDEVLGEAARAGLTLVRELVVGEQWSIEGAPAPATVRGFLFDRETGMGTTDAEGRI